MKQHTYTVLLEHIPVQIYQHTHTVLHECLTQLSTHIQVYPDSTNSIQYPNTFNNVQVAEKVSKHLFQVHPFSIIKVDKKLLPTTPLSAYFPSLIRLTTLPSQIKNLALPCIIWQIEHNHILLLISHRLVTSRNYTTTALEQQKHISLLLNTRQKSIPQNHKQPLLICYIHPNDIYSTLALLQLHKDMYNTYTIIISDTINIESIREYHNISYHKEILVSYYFIQQAPQLMHVFETYKFTVHFIHDVQHIICGIGTCRLCVEVQEKNNYEVCKKGLFQTFLYR